MKKKFTKLAASIGIALTQSSNADTEVAIENGSSDTNSDVQLYKLPLNMETPIFLAAHGSHRSHGSHSSHRSSSSSSSGHNSHASHASHASHRSGSTTSSSGSNVIISNPLGNAKPKPVTSYPPKQKCPDYLLSARKSVVRQVQYHLVLSGDLDITDAIGSLGVIDSNTRRAVSSFQRQKGISRVSGTTLDNYTLNAMGISCN